MRGPPPGYPHRPPPDYYALLGGKSFLRAACAVLVSCFMCMYLGVHSVLYEVSDGLLMDFAPVAIVQKMTR